MDEVTEGATCPSASSKSSAVIASNAGGEAAPLALYTA